MQYSRGQLELMMMLDPEASHVTVMESFLKLSGVPLVCPEVVRVCPEVVGSPTSLP